MNHVQIQCTFIDRLTSAILFYIFLAHTHTLTHAHKYMYIQHTLITQHCIILVIEGSGEEVQKHTLHNNYYSMYHITAAGQIQAQEPLCNRKGS